MIGLVVVTIFVLFCGLRHFFWKYDAKMDLDYGSKLLAPVLRVTEESPEIHIFGTDKLGRDIFRRVVHGGWNSLRVGLVAVSISLSIGGILGLFAGFFESADLNRVEKSFLMAAIGLGLGALPAWISRQHVQSLLFALLGVVSVSTPSLFAKKTILRRLVFGLFGILIGGLVGFIVGPMVALVCGVLGLGIGLLLARPVGGKVFSNIVMRIMDVILSFPSYLLAIAIVAFLGQVWKRA